METLQSRLIAEEKVIASYKTSNNNTTAFQASGTQLNNLIHLSRNHDTYGFFFFHFSVFKGDYYNSQQKGNGDKYLHGVHGGRVEKHHDGRGGFPNGGRGGYHQAGSSNSNQEFNCLFCKVNTHPTSECRKMQTARINFLRGGHRGSSRGGANRGAHRGGNNGGAFSATSQVKVEPSEMLNEGEMDETDGM